MRTKFRSPVIRLVIAVATIAIATLLWFRFRNPGIEQDARTILSEMDQGDGTGLYHHGYEHERKLLGLTPGKIDALYKRLIIPRLSGFHPAGPVQSMVNRDASQGFAWQTMRDDAGHSIDFDATPWNTPNGGKQMVMARLQTAWIVEFRMKRGKSTDSEGCAEAMIEGVAHDRKTLEDIGIHGMVADDPEIPMCPWDLFTRRWTRFAARLRAEKAAGIPPVPTTSKG